MSAPALPEVAELARQDAEHVRAFLRAWDEAAKRQPDDMAYLVAACAQQRGWELYRKLRDREVAA